MKRGFTIITALALITFAGCNSTKVEQVKKVEYLALKGYTGVWALESFTDGSVADMNKIIVDIAYLSETNQYSISGFSGVNNFFATVDNNEKIFPLGDKLGMTMMSGPAEEMNFESELIKLLVSSNSWTSENHRLTITEGSKKAVFRLIPANDK